MFTCNQKVWLPTSAKLFPILNLSPSYNLKPRSCSCSSSIQILSSTLLRAWTFQTAWRKFVLFGDKCWTITNTLYVSRGIADTWSNHITPFLDVVNWSLELGFVPLASNRTSAFVQFETSESLRRRKAWKTQTPSKK